MTNSHLSELITPESEISFQIQTARPEEAGIPSGAVMKLLDRLEQYHIPMHSLQIMRNDNLVVEGYYAPCKKGQLHRMFSISKSLTSLAICKLEEEGRLSLDDPIIKYFPEYLPEKVHPWLASMTIRDMLMMRTCHASTTYKLDMTRNWVESFFTTPPDHKPGTVFHYDTSAPHTLCALTEKLTGKPMLTYLKDVLLREIGFSEKSYMLTDPFGVSLGGSGLMATPQDLLRLGCLLLHGGRIGKEELLPAAYLQLALSNQTATAVTGPVISESQGYGYQFWRGEHRSFVCYGMGGQLLICYPLENMIVVTTADTQGIGGGNQLIYNCLNEVLLPALSRQVLPFSPEADKLDARLKKLAISPLQKIYPVSGARYIYTESVLLPDNISCQEFPGYPEALSLEENMQAPPRHPERFLAGAVNGNVYHIQDNVQGFDTFCVNMTKEKGILTYTLKGQTCCIPFGWDHVLPFRFPVYDMFCAASGMCLDKNTLYIKVHLLDTSVGSVHFQLVFGEKDVTIFLKKTEESLYGEYNGHFYGVYVS